MRTGSHVSILGAVATVLDLADARSFSVRDGDHGMTLDLVDGRGERHVVELSVAEVAELISWSESRAERVSASHDSGDSGMVGMDARDEGVLRGFLERHTSRTLVGMVGAL